MIHGDRQAGAAVQSRAVIVAGVLIALFVAALLASGAAAVELAVPWNAIAILAVVAVIAGAQRLRG